MYSPVYSRDPKGRVHIGGHNIVDLVHRYGSPLYIYNFDYLEEVYKQLRRQLHPRIQLYYAVKANPNPVIIKRYIDLGAGFDLSSVEELRLVLMEGGNPAHLSFAGPGKTDEELKIAMTAQVHLLSVESLSELKSIAKIAGVIRRRIPVTIRVNPMQRVQGFSIKMGGSPSQFGIDEEQLPEVVSLVRQSRWLAITGLHVFSGTQSLDENAIAENVQNIVRLAEYCHATYNITFKVINLGGGLGLPYHQGEKGLNEYQLISRLNSVINAYLKNRPDTEFVLELGRYLVGSSGMYVATVVRKKESREATFLVLDGGMNHYLAASGNLGQVFRRNFPVIHGTKNDHDWGMQTYHVVGPLCTPLDRLATGVKLPLTDEGDLLVFPLAGAYAYTASPLNFLSHPAPAEVQVNGKEVFKIRNRIENWYTPDQSYAIKG